MPLRESHARGGTQRLNLIGVASQPFITGEGDWSTIASQVFSLGSETVDADVAWVEQRNQRSEFQPRELSCFASIVHTRGAASLHCALAW